MRPCACQPGALFPAARRNAAASEYKEASGARFLTAADACPVACHRLPPADAENFCSLQGGSVPESFWSELSPVSSDEIHYKLLRLIEANPELSQRDVARELGISLGKVNYCLQALIGRGLVKATNFKNSQNKAAYMYLLTRRGLQQKASLTVRFLMIKVQEYERLRAEIKQMRMEAKIGNSR